MKVLVTTTGGLGHTLPVVPLALELERRGHDVHWVGGPGIEATVAGTGIECTVAGLLPAQRLVELRRMHPELDTLPPQRPGRSRSACTSPCWRRPCCSRSCDRWSTEWQPDVVVHDAAELAGPLAAAAAGIPSVCQGSARWCPRRPCGAPAR